MLKCMAKSMILIVGVSLLSSINAAIHVNEVGYEPAGAKTAVLQDSSNAATFSSTFSIQNMSGEEVFTGEVNEAVTVQGWENRTFAVCDFSAFSTEGTFVLKCGDQISEEFRIAENVLFESTVADQVGFFQGMRAAPDDHTAVPKFGEDGSTYDVRGGWYDATGDRGKYLSHLSFANYMNPQQIPMVIWSLLRSYELNESYISSQNIAMIEEAAYGADYLMRVLDDAGYFYQVIFNRWGHAEEGFHICAWVHDPTIVPAYLQTGQKTSDYQAAFREGGGMAIAALAKAYQMDVSGEFTSGQYLQGAKKAYDHLKQNNLTYCDNGEENIIDDYCALTAAVELYKATADADYLSDAKSRAQSLISRFDERGFFFSDDAKRRPYYHAAEEGLPVIALIEYMKIDDSKTEEILSLLRKWKEWYLELAGEVSNPFNYARMYWAEPVSSGPGQIPGGNIALGKPVEVSSVQESHTAEQVVDGQSSTRWGSKLYNDADDLTCDEWVIIDLEKKYEIDTVFLMWEAAFATEYTIDVSDDGASWKTVYDTRNGDGGNDTIGISPVEIARYIRLKAEKRHIPYAGVSLYEFQVGGQPYADPDAPQEPVQGYTSFFQPHTNETGYWWQGENARIASMAAAFLWAEMTLDPAFRIGEDEVSQIALAQFDWILGKNPFGICMMYGYGKENYIDYMGIEAFPNIKGGICNGITADIETETDLAYMPYGGTTDDWRWIEQWLPHNAWYLFASATLSHVNERTISSIKGSDDFGRAHAPKAFFNSTGITVNAKGEDTKLIIMDLRGRTLVQKSLSRSKTVSYKSLGLSSGAYIAAVQKNRVRISHRFYISK